MKKTIGQMISKHIEEHRSLYVFSIVLFFMGVIFGTLTVQSLSISQQEDLFHYLERFMLEVNENGMANTSLALFQNYSNNLKYIGVIWILGLSIIGLPIILVLLFLKGVFIGFTVGFLIHQLGWHGFGFAFLVIVPHNLIVVPILLVMSVISISFSLQLISHLFGTQRFQKKPNIPKYLGTMFAAAIFLFLVALFETYISPMLMNIVG